MSTHALGMRHQWHNGTGEHTRGPQQRLFWDDFSDGFRDAGPGAFWDYQRIDTPFGSFVADDGETIVGNQRGGGLHVRAHPHPVTGLPAFRATQPLGPLGSLDHLKWLVWANHRASHDAPGFATEAGSELRIEAMIGGRTYGTAGHPFGAAVRNPFDDARLACIGLSAIDVEHAVVVAFGLTNSRIHAMYERLASGRVAGNAYAAFQYLVPLTTRRADQLHTLTMAYNRRAGVLRWLVEGREQFRIDAIGCHADRRHLVLDYGGTEERVVPHHFAPGFGMFNALDALGPDGHALVRLTDLPEHYHHPRKEAALHFVDETSREGSRLFGQGAELRVKYMAVLSQQL